MKRQVIAGYIACLVSMSSCESGITGLSSAIRSGWNWLNGNGPVSSSTEVTVTDAESDAASELSAVPGEPLTDDEKIRVVKAQGFAAFIKQNKNDTSEGREVLRENSTLLGQYPTHQPISDQEMSSIFIDRMPEKVGGYSLKGKEMYPFSMTEGVEYYPGVEFLLHDAYYTATVRYENPQNDAKTITAYDRGNFGGWARTAHWYHLRKGFVPKKISNDYQFSGTQEVDGRLWVIWTAKKTGRKQFISWWNDRFEVMVDGFEPSMVPKVFNIAWIEDAERRTDHLGY
jgi:hypothetical protein